jgi:hypothetical protein
MQRLSFRLTIALLTFLIGVALTFVWFAEPADVSKQRIVLGVTEPTANPENDEYAVYSAAIRTMFVDDWVKLLVIQDTTSDLKIRSLGETMKDMKEFYPSVADDTLEDYVARNAQAYRLSRSFQLPVRYELLSTAELERHSRKRDGGIEFFYKKYQGTWGLIRLSKAGFNRERDQAFLYIELKFCGLCGRGAYVHLSKDGDVWRIKETFIVWVS